MKYYLIAGEASGDLHAAHLMRSLKQKDPEAEFHFFGGDQMAAVGGTQVKHYRELAYMGFVPVLLHLPTILSNMRLCKRDISEWRPDVVILVDYPGFNLDIAKFVHRQGLCPVYYYIAPKIWAWKEYRIKRIKRDVDELFSILPFEVDFFEGKHHFPIHYVGNPTAEEVGEFEDAINENPGNGPLLPIGTERPVVALLAGSRRQEIKDNLPTMVQVARRFPAYQFVVAGAPGISEDYYARFLADSDVKLVMNRTYALLHQAVAALVTSGTATLETALFGVPQVVCYETPLPWLIGWLKKRVLKVRWVSLVNLIAGREVVPEMVADRFSLEGISHELAALLGEPSSTPRGYREQSAAAKQMKAGYDEVSRALGSHSAPREAARIMVELLTA